MDIPMSEQVISLVATAMALVVGGAVVWAFMSMEAPRAAALTAAGFAAYGLARYTIGKSISTTRRTPAADDDADD